MPKFFDVKTAGPEDFNYRWVQPPQVAYLVSTIDEYGNTNLTPVTLGTLNCAAYPCGGKPGAYYFSFAVSCSDHTEPGNAHEVRHAFLNLQKNRECVIGYIGKDLFRKSIACNMPVPYGISEFDVAGLTPFDSVTVQPKSILECPVNMECRVVYSHNLSGVYQFYLCEVTGVSVDEKYLEADKSDPRGLGVFHIDPLFEVQIFGTDKGSVRLHYGKLDKNFVSPTADDFGCLTDWVGKFETWIADECRRGKITEAEKARILELNALWKSNRDPVANAAVRQELTAALKKLCM